MGDTHALKLADQIARRLQSYGYQALFVGGCVRDQLLGIAPKDYDIATSARPEQVLELYPAAMTVGAHFGVVLVREGDAQVEVATFRNDFSYSDGRRPDRVVYETDPRRDALRRDFTINALMQDPVTGSLFDFTGGQEDLRSGIIRAIGNPADRFSEDHLRMLRAVRFAARFGFQLESSTEAAMASLSGQIRTVAAERVRYELNRILTEGGARYGFELLERTGLLDEVLPEVSAMKGVEQPPEYHPEGDVWTHTLLMLDGLGKCTAPLAWGVLLHDVGKPATFERADRIRFNGHVEKGIEIATALLARLRFSGDETSQILALIANHMRFMDVQRMRTSTLKRFIRQDHFEDHLALHRLDCLSSHAYLDNYEFAKTAWQQTPMEEVKPARLLTGADLIEMGLRPGPAFKTILDRLEDAQLEGTVRTRAEAVEFVGPLADQLRSE